MKKIAALFSAGLALGLFAFNVAAIEGGNDTCWRCITDINGNQKCAQVRCPTND